MEPRDNTGEDDDPAHLADGGVDSPSTSRSSSPGSSVRRETPALPSDTRNKDEQQAYELPSDMHSLARDLMTRIDQLQGVVSRLREKNAEFEVRLQTEGQLRRDMEMWWKTPPSKSENHRPPRDEVWRYDDSEPVQNPARSRTTPRSRQPRDEEIYRRTSDCVPFSTAGSEAITKLNRVKWDEFKAFPTGDEAERATFVVDVLVGDPPLTGFALSVRPSAAQPSATPQDSTPMVQNASLVLPLPTGNSPLPERIRINSPFIIEFLEATRASRYRKRDSIVMLQPFKALVYRAELIKKHHRRLDEKPEQDSNGRAADQTDGIPPSLQPELDGGSSGRNGGVTVLAAAESQGGRSEGALEKGPGEAAQEIPEQKPDPKAHFACLLEFIDDEIKRRMDYVRGGSCARVTYADLWLLFQPGDVIILKTVSQQAGLVLGTADSGHKAARPFRGGSLKAREEVDGFAIAYVVIEFDGSQLGPVNYKMDIPRFDGEKAIARLPCHPLAYSSIPDVQETLISRGKRFPGMVKVRHMHYSGPAYAADEGNPDYVDSQVVIDFEESFRHNPHWRPDIQNLVGADTSSLMSGVATTSAGARRCDDECCKNDFIFDDSWVEREQSTRYINSLMPQHRSQTPSLCIYPRSLDEIEASGTGFSDLEYLIMPSMACGFIMRSRKWARFYLDMLSPPNRFSTDTEAEVGKKPMVAERRENAFDQLVLPPGHKDMVKSLITQHFRDKESADAESNDIVRGKGKGLIILLHGAPGVGKTSTAECVAEYFDKPLFQITCGDLGVFAADVESALEKHFALASRWGCILLLDEADVFLSARSPTDQLRNSLVSVFLRTLEYYVGCLFLTTNRVGDFDEAFASRIHMSLYYPPLGLESTQRVFNLNLGRIEKRLERKQTKLEVDMVAIVSFIASYWHEYPQARWNGRQIRNGCQTALALAEFESNKAASPRVTKGSGLPPPTAVSLEVKHFQKVADAYLGFIEYLKDIYGVHADERAKENFLRASVRDPATLSKPASSMNPLLTRRGQYQHPHNSPWSEPTPATQHLGPQGRYSSGGYPTGPPSDYAAQGHASTPINPARGGYDSSGYSHHRSYDRQHQEQESQPYTTLSYQRHPESSRQHQPGLETPYPHYEPNVPPQDSTAPYERGWNPTPESLDK